MKNQGHVLLLLAILCVCTSAQPAAPQSWRWQYPWPQGNTLNDICLLSPDTAVAVGNLGTVIRTTNGGASWTVQHHAGDAPYDLYSVWFTDARHGWAAGGNLNQNRSVLLRSEDGGMQWTEVPTNDSLCYTVVAFLNADTGFVGGAGGVFLRTTDGGTGWTRSRIQDLTGFRFADVHRLHTIRMTGATTAWMIGEGFEGNELYQTTDAGRSWQWMRSSCLPVLYGGADLSFPDARHGFAVGHSGLFVRTSDGGATWQSQNLAQKYQKPEYQNFYSVSFTDSLSGGIVGGSNYAFVLKTNDGGETWTEVANNNSAMMHHFYRIRFSRSPHETSGWIVGQFGMIYRTTDAGATWTAQRQERYLFRAVYFTDLHTGWAAGESGVVFHTTDGGETWLKQYRTDTTLLFSSVYAMDPSHALIAGSRLKGPSVLDRSGVLLRTSDGGLTWAEQSFDSLYGFEGLAISTDSTGWISVSQGKILRSTDAGMTWSLVPVDASAPGAGGRVQFINPSTGWIGGALRTTDGGAHWETLGNPPAWPSRASFVNADLGFLVGNPTLHENIFKTTDGGKSWQPLGVTFGGSGFSIQFLSATTGWIAGSISYPSTVEEAIEVTTDGGATWHAQASPSLLLADIFFVNGTTGWAVGADGIIKTTDGGGLATVVPEPTSDGSVPHGFVLCQNYPNPFNPTTTIRYSLPHRSHITVTIFNTVGQKVTDLVNGDIEAGYHEIRFNAGHLASGIYFYRMRAGAFVQTRSLCVVR